MLKVSSNVLKRTYLSGTVRSFSITSTALAKKPAASKPVKKKVTFDPKKFQQPQQKVKKSGMTHLEFHDAVKEMNFDKLAMDLTPFELSELTSAVVSNESGGQVTAFTSESAAILKTLGSFKKYQHHELFSKPVSMVTHNTALLNEQFVEKLADASSRTNRVCLVGERGAGKSTLLAQAQALALDKYEGDVILLHIDAAENITDGSSDYIYNSKNKTYHQPMFTKRWIYKLRNSNEAVFKKLKLSRDISFQNKRVDHQLKKDENTLYDFLQLNVDFGKFQPTHAFSFFIEELVHHSKSVPVLLSVDNANAVLDFPVTKYRHHDFTPVHLNELEIGDFLLKVAGGEISFEKGGVLLSKTGLVGDHQKTLSTALGLVEYDPYAKKQFFDLDIANTLLAHGGVKPFTVSNLTKDETRTLLNFWRESGVVYVKDYVTKESLKPETEAEKKAPKPEFDSEAQFENLVNSYYTVSTGNPHYLLKASAISY
ncbi:hypothetical protein G9P44_004210 [Scheffersomyces stipitis]|nr:hypothetical protein G9P44_004210 [Scheffersomyces stipitis]